jgi:hypothetical protein
MSKQRDKFFSVVALGHPDAAPPGFKDILSLVQRAEALRGRAHFLEPGSSARKETKLDGLVNENGQKGTS